MNTVHSAVTYLSAEWVSEHYGIWAVFEKSFDGYINFLYINIYILFSGIKKKAGSLKTPRLDTLALNIPGSYRTTGAPVSTLFTSASTIRTDSAAWSSVTIVGCLPWAIQSIR